jgi:hypothetical protein
VAKASWRLEQSRNEVVAASEPAGQATQLGISAIRATVPVATPTENQWRMPVTTRSAEPSMGSESRSVGCARMPSRVKPTRAPRGEQEDLADVRIAAEVDEQGPGAPERAVYPYGAALAETIVPRAIPVVLGLFRLDPPSMKPRVAIGSRR